MTDDLRQWCRNNWNKIDPLIRKDCVDHLEGWIPLEEIEWLRGYNNEAFFHFSCGMAIRNRLREQYTDPELPVVEYNMEGGLYNAQNWDDYYTGAIDEFLERHPK